MENQHRKIKGYRELSQQEIDLMNRIKAKGAELLALQAELSAHLSAQHLAKETASVDAELRGVHDRQALQQKLTDIQNGHAERSAELLELHRFNEADPHRWANIGKTDIQTGIMALVRAVAQPSEC